MELVPPKVVASGPTGTSWFGGAVDRSKMSLRVMSKAPGCAVDKDEISRLLGRESDQQNLRHWSLHAPESVGGNIDYQIDWLLSGVTSDAAAWRALSAKYRVDLFCGLFLKRPNRGVSMSPKMMGELSLRGIEIGFDIYAPLASAHNSTCET